MEPAHELVPHEGAFCLRKKGEVYAVYLPEGTKGMLDLSEENGAWEVYTYNIWTGAFNEDHPLKEVSGGGKARISEPYPIVKGDQLLLLKKLR